jgi:hypothetical protein
MITATMVLGGIALVLASLAVGLGPVALVAGVLLLWSAMVKVIVLRIWRVTLAAAPAAEGSRPPARAERSRDSSS